MAAEAAEERERVRPTDRPTLPFARSMAVGHGQGEGEREAALRRRAVRLSMPSVTEGRTRTGEQRRSFFPVWSRERLARDADFEYRSVGGELDWRVLDVSLLYGFRKKTEVVFPRRVKRK